jgi:hypothetical protein
MLLKAADATAKRCRKRTKKKKEERVMRKCRSAADEK